MRLSRRLWLFALCIPCVASGHAQAPSRKLTLTEARALAVQNHPQLQAANLRASAAKEIVTEVRSAYLPYAYGSLTAVDAEHGSRIAAGGLNNPIILERYANGVTFSQMLTDFGRTANLSGAARSQAKAQDAGAQTTRADVILGVDRAYYQALRAAAVLRVAEETVRARQLVADQVSALGKSGLKSSLDVKFAEVNLAQAKLLEVEARNQLDAAFADLSRALGSLTPEKFELAEETLPPAPPAQADVLVEQAFRERPELAALRFSAEGAHHLAKAERDLWLPTISAVGATGLVPVRDSALTSRYAAVGVNVNIPLFNGRLFSARHAEAEFRAKAQDLEVQDLQNRVARDVRVAWLDAQSAYQRLDLTRQLLDESRQAFELAQSRYKLGLSSIVELSQAQLNETQAEIEQASAKYDYQIQRSVLDYQMGTLR